MTTGNPRRKPVKMEIDHRDREQNERLAHQHATDHSVTERGYVVVVRTSKGQGSTSSPQRRDCSMAIARLLHEAAFPPDRVRAIAQAYENTCKRLVIADREDPLANVVAKKIIKVAKGGARDPEPIMRQVIKELLGAYPG